MNGNVAMGGGNDLVVLYTQSINNGTVDGQGGTNTLRLAGTTTGSIDLSKLANFQFAEKIDAGTWSLAGAGGFATATTVGGGTLSVNGTLTTPSLTVQTGGTLGGTGTIVGNTAINGGTLSPGNSPGTLSIRGTLSFTAAAAYLVQISGNTNDKTVVTGTATLAGSVVVQPLTRISQTTTYTILTAGSVNGTFAGATFLVSDGLARNPHLTYDANDVFLTLDPGLLSPLLPSGANINQRTVATAIDNAILAGNNPSAGFNALFNASGSNLLNALTQASGEIATRTQQTTFSAMNIFIGLITDPFMQRSGGVGPAPGTPGYTEEEEGASAYAARKSRDPFGVFTKAPLAKTYDPRWSVWAAGFGGSQTTDGNAALGSNNATSSIAGTAVGADYLFSPNTVAGFALAGGGTSFAVANGGTGRSDLFQAGAYLRHTNGPIYVSAALAYGWQDITTDRNVTIAGLDHLRAEFNANAYSGRVEGGYRLVAPWIGGIGITPYAAGQFTTLDLPAYAEQVVSGTPNFALSYATKSVTDTRSELGIRTDKSFAVQNCILTLRGRFAWAHDFDPDRNIAATFQALPGASFVVNGAAQASDSALTTASAEMKWMNGWSAAATFEGEFSNVTRSYAGKGVVRYAW